MVENTDKEGEEAMFEIIRSPSWPDENEEDDGTLYLNNTGEGDMIFDEDEQMDEVQNYDDIQITNTGEVYLYKQASSDHHMFF